MRQLTKNEARYVEIWLETGSLVEAYAGAYNSKMTGSALCSSAKKIARREHVRSAYDSRKAALVAVAQKVAEERHGVTVDRIMREHKAIGFASMRDYIAVSQDGLPYVDLSRLTHEQGAAISEVIVETASDTSAQGGRVKVLRVRFKLHSKQASLIEMGKHLGMYELDNLQKGAAEPAAAAARQAPAREINDDVARRLALLLTHGDKVIRAKSRLAAKGWL